MVVESRSEYRLVAMSDVQRKKELSWTSVVCGFDVGQMFEFEFEVWNLNLS